MSDQDIKEYDVIIIGGGMVGASLVAALKNHSDKNIAVVEAIHFNQNHNPVLMIVLLHFPMAHVVSGNPWVYGEN